MYIIFILIIDYIDKIVVFK